MNILSWSNGTGMYSNIRFTPYIEYLWELSRHVERFSVLEKNDFLFEGLNHPNH